MDVSSIEKLVYELSIPVVNSFNYELVDVEFVKEHNEWYLRIYIDKEGGITIDDCSNVSRIISNKLDEIDPIDCSYYLEVSSPGIDRPLKKDSDFEKHKGKKVKVKLFAPIDGKKTIEGTLLGLEGNDIVISSNDKEMHIDKNKVSIVKLSAL